jgi:hypothetical protein
MNVADPLSTGMRRSSSEVRRSHHRVRCFPGSPPPPAMRALSCRFFYWLAANGSPVELHQWDSAAARRSVYPPSGPLIKKSCNFQSIRGVVGTCQRLSFPPPSWAMPSCLWSQSGPASSQTRSLFRPPVALLLSFVVISCVVWRGRCGPLHAFFRTRHIRLPRQLGLLTLASFNCTP